MLLCSTGDSIRSDWEQLLHPRFRMAIFPSASLCRGSGEHHSTFEIRSDIQRWSCDKSLSLAFIRRMILPAIFIAVYWFFSMNFNCTCIHLLFFSWLMSLFHRSVTALVFRLYLSVIYQYRYVYICLLYYGSKERKPNTSRSQFQIKSWQW